MNIQNVPAKIEKRLKELAAGRYHAFTWHVSYFSATNEQIVYTCYIDNDESKTGFLTKNCSSWEEALGEMEKLVQKPSITGGHHDTNDTIPGTRLNPDGDNIHRTGTQGKDL